MVLEKLLENAFGVVSMNIALNGKILAEISMEEKKIIVTIKNPILAIQAFIQEISQKKNESHSISKLKELGYEIEIQYAGLKVSL